MKLANLFKIVSLSFLLILEGCEEEELQELGDCNMEIIVKSVTEAKGIVWYDEQVKSYAIFAGIPETFDGQDIGIVCDLPEQFEVEATAVTFSGNYYQNSEFVSQMPGQTYYYLELTNVETFLNK
jgi:hypothetical protein